MHQRAALASLCLLVTACGGDAPPPAQEEAVPHDSAIVTDLPREPLTEADLAGIDPTDLSVEVPWTSNRISRDAGPAAPRAFLEAVVASTHDGFDRVTFTFSDSAPFPGYFLEILVGELQLSCDGQAVVLQGDVNRLLNVLLTPARASDDAGAGPRAGLRPLNLERFGEGGLACDTGAEVAWIAGLSSGSQVRVLELRNPNRLVVDLR